jgi:hypothetical protein
LKRWLVLVLALAAGVGLAHPGGSEAQVTTCLPGPGILLDGVTMTYTARSGDANDVQIVKTGGTYTPPNTNGIPVIWILHASCGRIRSALELNRVVKPPAPASEIH